MWSFSSEVLPLCMQCTFLYCTPLSWHSIASQFLDCVPSLWHPGATHCAEIKYTHTYICFIAAHTLTSVSQFVTVHIPLQQRPWQLFTSVGLAFGMFSRQTLSSTTVPFSVQFTCLVWTPSPQLTEHYKQLIYKCHYIIIISSQRADTCTIVCSVQSLTLVQLDLIHLWMHVSPVHDLSVRGFACKLQLCLRILFPLASLHVTFLLWIPSPQSTEHWMWNNM